MRECTDDVILIFYAHLDIHCPVPLTKVLLIRAYRDLRFDVEAIEPPVIGVLYVIRKSYPLPLY